MRRRLRAAWALGYLGLCAFDIGSAWGTRWPASAKVNVTVLTLGIVGWFLGWRFELRHRKLLQERLKAETEAQVRRQMMRAADWLN